MADQYEPVVFEDSAGNIISNDPIYLAQAQLAAAGLINPQISAPAVSDEDSIDDEDEVDYSKLNGRELKALAKERGVDITGLKTVGEVRTALAEDDAAKAAESESDEDDDK